MKKKSFIINLLLVSFIALFFSSCDKDEIAIPQSNEISEDIVSFENFAEYNTAEENVLAMNSEELKNYEESLGYKSFGRASEEFYRNIEMDEFKSKEGIVSFVEKNSHYLQLIDDENGEFELETKFYNNPQRYFLNKNKMFEIGNSLYKLIEEGTIVCSSENIEMLKQIGDHNIDAFKKDTLNLKFIPNNIEENIGSLKDATYNCGTQETLRKTDGRDRLKVFLKVYIYGAYVKTKVLIRPYKKTWGVWYHCRRTIKANIKIATDYYVPYHGWQRAQYSYYNSGEKAYKLERTIGSEWIPDDSYGKHIGGYSVWADTPSVPALKKDRNSSILN